MLLLLSSSTVIMIAQESMTCTFPTDAVPCSEAASLYNLNNNFGVIPDTTAKSA